jgi:hypothetical protein
MDGLTLAVSEGGVFGSAHPGPGPRALGHQLIMRKARLQVGTPQSMSKCSCLAPKSHMTIQSFISQGFDSAEGERYFLLYEASTVPFLLQ